MNLQTEKTEEEYSGAKKCSRERIAVYLDGELSLPDEICLEKHFVDCADCLSELNLQKRLLSALDSRFMGKDEIPLPENFAKVVATRAETNVKGLSSNKERTQSFLICATLFSVAAAALGVKALIFSFSKFGEQVLAVAGFAGRLAFDLIIGITVILRSVGSQPVFNSSIVFLIVTTAFSAIVLSRRFDDSGHS